MLIRPTQRQGDALERIFPGIDQLHLRLTTIGGAPPPIFFAAIWF